MIDRNLVQSYNQMIQESVQKHWNLNAMSDYGVYTLQYKDVARIIEKMHILFESAGVQKGDKIALDIFEFTGEMLGRACADFACFNSPEAFVFFGGLTKAGHYIMDPIKRAYDENVLSNYKGKAQIVFSALKGSEAAVLGASALGWE